MGVYFISDTHFGHDKEFIWKKRGYCSIDEHNVTIVSKINSIVNQDDTLYILGDVCMGDVDKSIKYLDMVLCEDIHIIRGNHDTDRRVERYLELGNVVEVCGASFLKYKKWSFYLSHYPSMTANMNDDAKALNRRMYNISGHTHSDDMLENFPHGVINVAIDAIGGYPIEIEKIIDIICKNFQKNN